VAGTFQELWTENFVALLASKDVRPLLSFSYTSGKSSIVKLIQHLYEPSVGQVRIDDIDVHELSAEFLCRAVSVVPQEPTLMARSVKRNIMYGLEGTDSEPSQEEIEEAAKLANASSFIEALPERYETQVGERGIQLSGGQVR